MRSTALEKVIVASILLTLLAIGGVAQKGPKNWTYVIVMAAWWLLLGTLAALDRSRPRNKTVSPTPSVTRKPPAPYKPDPDYWVGKYAGWPRPGTEQPKRIEVAKPEDPPGPRLWVPRSVVEDQ